MDWSSWFRAKTTKQPNQYSQKQDKVKEKEEEEEEEGLLGVTQQLIDHVKSFTLDTFKNFPLQKDEATTGATFNDEFSTTAKTTTSANVRNDLSEWQERHATLVLSKVKELSQLRFMLCPRHLKEQQFWRIYFMLVKSYVVEYEVQAIQLAKLKKMAMEDEKSSKTSAVEVEMAETKQATSLAPAETKQAASLAPPTP